MLLRQCPLSPIFFDSKHRFDPNYPSNNARNRYGIVVQYLFEIRILIPAEIELPIGISPSELRKCCACLLSGCLMAINETASPVLRSPSIQKIFPAPNPIIPNTTVLPAPAVPYKSLALTRYACIRRSHQPVPVTALLRETKNAAKPTQHAPGHRPPSQNLAHSRSPKLRPNPKRRRHPPLVRRIPRLDPPKTQLPN